MRPSPFILSAMLAAALLAGCSEDPLAVADQSSYRQTTTTTTTDTTTSQGIYSDPYSGVATSSTVASTSTAPATATGVQAQVTASQPRGLIKKTFELTIYVSNPDSTEHTGFLIATFKDSAGKTELQYLYLSLAAGASQNVTISSTKPATSGSVVFSERLL